MAQNLLFFSHSTLGVTSVARFIPDTGQELPIPGEVFSMDLPSASMLSPFSRLQVVKDHPETLPSGNKAFLLQPEDFQKFLAGSLLKGGSVETAKAKSIPTGERTVFDSASVHRAGQSVSRSWAEQFRIYREEQLLAHPGGDSFDLKDPDPRSASPYRPGFWERLGKDIKDSLDNASNFVKDLVWGSEYRYRDERGRIQFGQRKGLLKSAVGFFKNIVCGLSFGRIRTNGDTNPQGVVDRMKYAGGKLLGKALLDDLIFGVSSSARNLLDDAALAAWNLMEVVPDATIGNFPLGQRLVTTLFDNGQVVVDYITDCLPTGDAWMRVHACSLENEKFTPPVLFNLRLPEQYGRDSRWSAVRNTPFRKTIETIGSLLADIGVGMATHYALRTSKGRD